MERDSREQASWLLLVFESGLPIRVLNDIIFIWCKQLQRTVQDFFTASTEEWATTCQLNEKIIQKLEEARAKLVGQSFLVEQLQQEQIRFMTVLDPDYPTLVKSALDRRHIPPILFSIGDLDILKRQTIAIIGSRNAGESSLAFTRSVAHYLADHGVNVISGYARGVDRSAYEGVTGTDGYTTVVLPHGLHKLSKTQLRELQPRVEAGKVLVLSQFHPDAPWLVSRAMERNNVVTGLAQIVIVAEADSKGGTWEGANGALKQGRRVYVRNTEDSTILPGNKLLLEKGGQPIPWPLEEPGTVLDAIFQESIAVQRKQDTLPAPLDQLSLLALPYE